MDMAKVNVQMPEEFLLRISRLGDQIDVIAPKVLEVGGEVVLEKVKGNLRTSIGKDTKYPSRTKGELLSSLGLSDAKQDRDGNYNVKVGFAEPRSDGESNAKIANIIEYGKHGQPAKPFLRPARTASRKPCTDAMIAKLEEEIGKL
jgi:hypothetical protein